MTDAYDVFPDDTDSAEATGIEVNGVLTHTLEERMEQALIRSEQARTDPDDSWLEDIDSWLTNNGAP